MRKFFFQILLAILIVITSIGTLNFVIDPFGFNGLFPLELPKEKVSGYMNDRLFKMAKFKHYPKANIILGDSRSASLSTKLFDEAGAYDFFNFAFGGGTLYEALDTFWYAAKFAKLKTVIIGVPFNLYHDLNRMNLTSDAERLIQRPGYYYLNIFVVKASLSNLYTRITGNLITVDKPAADKQTFWTHQLSNYVTGAFYSKWTYPVILLKKLRSVSEYCRQNDIELIFIIPPTHIDLQRRVEDFNLQTYYDHYRQELAGMAKVIDFDFPNAITSDRNNFNDPYHCNKETSKKVVFELVKKTNNFSRVYERVYK